MLERTAALRKFVCIFAIGAGTVVHAQSPLLTSGFYGNHTLQLVVSPDGSFTGHFFDKAGVGAAFTCNFLIHGDGKNAKRGAGYRVMTWWPTTQLDGGKNDEAVYGVLRLSPKSLTLQLPKGAHDGCFYVNKLLDVGWPVELKREDQETLWRELRIVQVKHTLLHAQPDAASETSEEIYQGDVVTIVATRGEWQHIDYYSQTAGRTLIGWVKDSTLLAPIAPTEQQPAKKPGPAKPEATKPDAPAEPPAETPPTR
jgi:hypothetical protein